MQWIYRILDHLLLLLVGQCVEWVVVARSLDVFGTEN